MKLVTDNLFILVGYHVEHNSKAIEESKEKLRHIYLVGNFKLQ